MEKALNKIISKWKDVQFELIPHKSTTIQTLKLGEVDFEALEDH